MEIDGSSFPRCIITLERDRQEQARLLLKVLNELADVKLELSLAYNENKRLQKAYDKLMRKYVDACESLGIL